MQTPLTWRELLGNAISDPQERQRIANELGVTPVSLNRWAKGETTPREQILRRLLQALPEQRTLLLALLRIEFPNFTATPEERGIAVSDEIPSAFYSRALNAYATTPDTQRFWSISNLILQQALGQLDPNQVGMAITIVQCMPPKGGKVLSLRERVGRGTPPWNTNLEQQAIFLGAESLAGAAVMEGHPAVLQDRRKNEGLYPAHWVEWEESAAAIPLLRAGKIAGSLLVSCTQPNYFLPNRYKLIQNYAQLISLVFEAQEFYAPQEIELRVMPNYHTQERHLSGFRQRVSTLMIESARNRRSLTIIDAERLAWQQLEDELILIPILEQTSEKHQDKATSL
jgi:transcriptional regulator with XRE-family HTH domain